MKPKCINPELGKRLYLEIRKKGPHEEHISLVDDLKRHAEACPHCSTLFPLWMISGGGGLAATAEKVLAEIRQGTPDILHTRGGDLDVYFRRDAPNSRSGLLISVRADGSLNSVDQTTIDRFYQS
jgi:hypothetical protein